jgi:16S rRNA (uracil1498-N3)-methyltransferase
MPAGGLGPTWHPPPPPDAKMPPRPPSPDALPVFFVDVDPVAGGTGRLLEGEAEHARVLRLGPGDHCLGFDGRGGRHLFEIRSARGGQLDLGWLERVGDDLEPGQPGSALPWIELAVAWPRKTIGERLLGPLVQLGVARITPLSARWSGASDVPAHPPARWHKLVREACKQCERAWVPELGEPLAAEHLPGEREGATIAILDAREGMSFDTWLRSLVPGTGRCGTRENPLVLAIGPEGGFAPEEREAFLEHGATRIRLAPHVLRIETAALAALAVAGTTLMRTA